MKRKIKLTESDLHRIVKTSIKRVLKESINSTNMLAQLLTGLDENTAESVASEIEFAYNNGYDFDEMARYLSEKLNPTPYSQI